MSLALLSLFIPTFFIVSITPGMCMMLAFSMGLSIGVRRTLWMMLGELVGVGLVASAAAIGVATIMLNYPALFLLLKYGGGAYLLYLGIQLWRSRGKLAFSLDQQGFDSAGRWTLISQGFVTAIANPKGWAFFIALLPPFIDYQQPMMPQLVMLVSMILVLELLCLLIYSVGARSLRQLLVQSGKVRAINRLAGCLMIAVGLWLALD